MAVLRGGVIHGWGTVSVGGVAAAGADVSDDPCPLQTVCKTLYYWLLFTVLPILLDLKAMNQTFRGQSQLSNEKKRIK